jgi:Tol biopolymer transport system component
MLDQINSFNPNPPMISTGKGRTTCAYFMPGDSLMLYASTHLADDACPPPPAPREDRKYLWQIDPGYDIFVANAAGEIVKQITNEPGYDAEATVSPNGKYIVFTSTRNGDLDLYLYEIASGKTTQVTNTLGYDGGAFFSPDSKKLLFRASRPKTDEAIAEYKALLKEGLVAPTDMEIFTCNLDGSELTQITKLGRANWAPFFHPDGKRILFSSNHHSPRGFPFNIFMINIDGSGLEQVTFDQTFDSFPMFSPDGRKLVFSSNRFNGGSRDTNVFVVDWLEDK